MLVLFLRRTTVLLYMSSSSSPYLSIRIRQFKAMLLFYIPADVMSTISFVITEEVAESILIRFHRQLRACTVVDKTVVS